MRVGMVCRCYWQMPSQEHEKRFFRCLRRYSMQGGVVGLWMGCMSHSSKLKWDWSGRLHQVWFQVVPSLFHETESQWADGVSLTGTGSEVAENSPIMGYGWIGKWYVVYVMGMKVKEEPSEGMEGYELKKGGCGGRSLWVGRWVRHADVRKRSCGDTWILERLWWCAM